MIRNYCTLFDIKYVDKGLALYYSLKKNSTIDFHLYILCLDNQLMKIMNSLKKTNITLISLEEFETKKLLEVKKGRTNAEYCWTCTPSFIKHVFLNYNVDNCTYLDADLFFYSDPEIIFKDLKEDAIVVSHRLPNTPKWRKIEKSNGKYCVEFNYFNNCENSQKMLEWWTNACLKWCYARNEEGKYGDQKYLENIFDNFSNVKVDNHIGAGVAPWNLCDYELDSNEGYKIKLKYGEEKDLLIFYHFAGIRYINKHSVNINTNSKNSKIKKEIYHPYLKLIEQIRSYLNKEYGVEFQITKSYSNNLLRKLIQKYVRQFKINSLSDVIDLKKI